MGMVYCDNCGTSLDESAKFCRACGKPTPLSEVATKRFDQQPAFQTPTSPVGTASTSPTYYPPYELAAAQPTNDLKKKRKRNLIIIASLFAVMIFALAGLLIFLIEEGTPAVVDPAGVSIPSEPTAPSPPPIPPIPPTVPTGGSSKIDSSLIYPGSTKTMVTEESNKSVLSLHTNDSSTKVADWYTARLKDAKRVSFIGQTVLKSGDLAVVIIGAGNGTEILITRDAE